MTIDNVKLINEEYKKKMEEENYEVDLTMDIYSCTNEILIWYNRIGTDADTCTGGEATRRFENGMRELETLMGKN